MQAAVPELSQGDRRFKRAFLAEGKAGPIYLTPRELQTLAHFVRGKTMVRVAQVLALSPRTVECYLVSLKRKFACESKSELIQWVVASDMMARLASDASLRLE